MTTASAYSCPSCGGPLHLEPSSGRLVCDYCDSSYSVDEIESRVDESYTRKQADKAAADADRAAGVSSQPSAGPTDKSEWGKFRKAYHREEFTDTVTYTCVNCGAQVIADQNTAATTCQYCGSNIVADTRVNGGLKPDYVIPFRIEAKDLPDLLNDFYKDRPLLPRGFFDANKMQKVQGMYVPFWLFNGEIDGRMDFDAEDVSTYASGHDDVTETKHFKVVRAGSARFDRIPVDASERMDDDLMDSIEPFNYDELVPFKPAYLTGFVAERFDEEPDEVFNRAELRMVNSAEEVMSESIPHASVTCTNKDLRLRSSSVDYVMLPVYLFNCEYAGKSFRYAVNGQTGKVVGEVPTGKRESRIAFLKAAAITFVVGAVIAAAVLLFG